MRATALLLVLGLAVALVAVVARGRAYDPARDAAWIAGAVPVGRAEAEVYARYLERHRAHRRVGGLFGVLFALVVGLAWYTEVRVGVGGRSPLADPLFCGIAGALLGALSAETYRLRLPRAGTATPGAPGAPRGAVAASLAPRPELPGRRHVVGAWALAAAGAVGGAVLLAATGDAGALAVAVLGAGVVALCGVTRRAVRHRRRPALSSDAAVVDARIRGFAAGSVARLGLAGAVLAAAWVVSALPAGPAWWGAAQTALVLAGLAAAVVLLVRAAPRPRRAAARPHPFAGTVRPS